MKQTQLVCYKMWNCNVKSWDFLTNTTYQQRLDTEQNYLTVLESAGNSLHLSSQIWQHGFVFFVVFFCFLLLLFFLFFSPVPFGSLAIRVYVWRPRKMHNGFTLWGGSSLFYFILFYFVTDRTDITGGQEGRKKDWKVGKEKQRGRGTVREDTQKKSAGWPVRRKKREKTSKRRATQETHHCSNNLDHYK